MVDKKTEAIFKSQMKCVYMLTTIPRREKSPYSTNSFNMSEELNSMLSCAPVTTLSKTFLCSVNLKGFSIFYTTQNTMPLHVMI